MRNGYQSDLQNYDHVKPYSYDHKVWLIYASTNLRPAIDSETCYQLQKTAINSKKLLSTPKKLLSTPKNCYQLQKTAINSETCHQL